MILPDIHSVRHRNGAKMRYIALFFPAILSVGILYKKEEGRNWNWFDYLYKYAVFLIGNVLLTESLISYVFKLGTVTIDAFDSFPFFTKYLFIASVLAIVSAHVYRIMKANISVSLEIHKNTDHNADTDKDFE